MIFLAAIICASAIISNAQPVLGEAGMIDNSTDCDIDLHVGCVELDGCEIYEFGAPVVTKAAPMTSTTVPASGCPWGSYVIYYVTWSHPGCAGIQSGVFVNPNIPAWIQAPCGYNYPDNATLPGCPYNGCNATSYPVTWNATGIQVGP